MKARVKSDWLKILVLRFALDKVEKISFQEIIRSFLTEICWYLFLSFFLKMKVGIGLIITTILWNSATVHMLLYLLCVECCLALVLIPLSFYFSLYLKWNPWSLNTYSRKRVSKGTITDKLKNSRLFFINNVRNFNSGPWFELQKQSKKKKMEKTGFSIAADHGAQHSLSSNLVRVTAAIASSNFHQ